jgi:hypothetical protein
MIDKVARIAMTRCQPSALAISTHSLCVTDGRLLRHCHGG